MHCDFFYGLRQGALLFKRFIVRRCLYANDCRGVLLCLDQCQNLEPVVVKIVYRSAADGEFYHRLYQREVSFLSRISSPYVVKAQSFLHDEQFSAFCMPYHPCGDLADVLDAPGRVPLSSAVSIAQQLCHGLAAINRSTIVHRDLKPENVLISERGSLKICDFDIAVDEREIAYLDESVVGSPEYVSPELIEKGDCDHRSDIYSVGLIAYETITGQNPYRGKSSYDSLALRVGGKAAFPHQLRGSCPEPLSRAVMKSIEKNPDERYQHVSEFLRDILSSGHCRFPEVPLREGNNACHKIT
jgi:serine/threonine-protein kinase